MKKIITGLVSLVINWEMVYKNHDTQGYKDIRMSQLTAITPQVFANKAWKRCTSYAFAAQATILPVMVNELVKLVPAVPLGFVQTEGGFQLVAITALQPGTNLFVAPDGRWLSAYVPATLRGYPFRLVKPKDLTDSILCFHESSDLLVDAGMGEPFFDEAGQPSKAVQDVMKFLLQVERNRGVTQAAVDALNAAGLIRPWPLNMKQGEQIVPVKGLYRIDEAALNSLDNEAFLPLRHSGALPVAYAQLMSMNQLIMLEQLAQIQAKLQTQASTVVQNLAGLEGIGLSIDDETLKFS